MILKALFPIDEMNKIEKILLKINNLKNHAHKEKHGLSVEVVFMGEAINLLLATKKNQEIQEKLMNQGVVLAACNNAMKAHHLTLEDLIPAAQKVTSGVGEIIIKQMEGWAAYWS